MPSIQVSQVIYDELTDRISKREKTIGKNVTYDDILREVLKK